MALFTDKDKTFHKNIIDYITEVQSGEFEIPVFQRKYSWKKKSVIAILNSISDNFFLGSIIFWESSLKGLARTQDNLVNDATRDSFIYIIDGQQRTLTLISLFSKHEIVDVYKTAIYVGVVEENLVFTSNKNDIEGDSMTFAKWKQVFFNVVNPKNPGLKKESFDNFLMASKTFSGSLNRNSILGYKIAAPGKDLDYAVRQFNKINDTGMKLSQFDILASIAFSDNEYNLRKKAVAFKDKGMKGTILKDEKFTNDSKQIIVNSYKLIKNFETRRKKEVAKGKLVLSLSANAISEFKRGDSKILDAILKNYKSYTAMLKSRGIDNIKNVPSPLNIVSYIVIKWIMKKDNINWTGEPYAELIMPFMCQTGFMNSYDKSSSGTLTRQIQMAVEQIETSHDISLWTDSFKIDETYINGISYKKINDIRAKSLLIFLDAMGNNVDYKTNEKVKLSGIFENEKNLDHIFPHSKYDHNDIHSFANIAVITSDTNKAKSDQDPSQYFSLISYEDNKEMYNKQFINKKAHEYLLDDNLNDFLDERRQNMLLFINTKIN